MKNHGSLQLIIRVVTVEVNKYPRRTLRGFPTKLITT